MSQLRLDCHSSFMDLFWKVKKIRKDHLCKLGIIPSHFRVLRSIKPGDALTISELSSIVKMESSNIISIIDCFEEKGFLQRKRDTEDRRIVRVNLTPEGERYREEMIKKHDDFIVRIYSNLDEEEVKRFKEILSIVESKINANII